MLDTVRETNRKIETSKNYNTEEKIEEEKQAKTAEYQKEIEAGTTEISKGKFDGGESGQHVTDGRAWGTRLTDKDLPDSQQKQDLVGSVKNQIFRNLASFDALNMLNSSGLKIWIFRDSNSSGTKISRILWNPDVGPMKSRIFTDSSATGLIKPWIPRILDPDSSINSAADGSYVLLDTPKEERKRGVNLSML
ncbi:LOW QUALITY PROTEIN: hypothetical protein Cgig2_033898 [Carnegiea gigantea]|uniref:Uncharacterized protein n=1 Tax=Carnegiea gigantea TaxID=171969 RepID=A0A9Q1GLT4_9CARY|nr:LOW QUALITY PROTEIN: hypothetical protein Cgig2_033898 [Carnegiea gigantea]